jgi:transcriptional regulator with XRE-family HTH domain
MSGEPESNAASMLKALRRERGWTQEYLAETSGLTVRTIRGIELGEISRPRRSTVDRLSAVLGGQGRDVLDLREAWAPSGSDAAHHPLHFEADGYGSEILARLTHESFEETSSVGVIDKVWTDADGRVIRERSEDVIVARIDGVRRRLTFCQLDEDIALGASKVSVNRTCRLGRTWTFPVLNLIVYEFLFDRALRRGETHRFRYEFEHVATYDNMRGEAYRSMIRGFQRPVAFFALEIQFGSDVTSCREASLAHPGNEIHLGKHRQVRNRRVEMCLSGHVVGGHGLTWTLQADSP